MQKKIDRHKGFLSKKDFDLLLKLAVRWEREAAKCAKVHAYYGACIVAAASIEAMLLATCELRSDEVEKAKASLKLGRPIWRLGLGELLKIAKEAGWLIPEPQGSSKPDILEIAHLVRRVRDLCHPGRVLHEMKRVTLPPAAFQVAWYTIDAVREQLANKLGIQLPPISEK